MDFKDYYSTLGVAKTATAKEVKQAYRKLARKFHPDLNPNDKASETRFKEINEAYEVLGDPDKRKKYDELGSRWREYEQAERARAAGGSRAEPFDWGSAGAAPGGARYEYRSASPDDLRDLFGDEAPFSDFFETFFSSSTGRAAGAGTSRPRRARAGSDLEHPVEVSLAEAYTGTTVTLSLRSPEGKDRRIEVKIPPGVRTGSRVRVAKQGAPGQSGGAAGDLYLVVTVQPDPRFERRGDDLHTEVRAPLATLVLGGEVRVPTPDGRALALAVPGGTQDGRIFRLRGQGMPRLGKPDGRGDLHAEVHARMPERLSARERELFEEFVRAGSAEAAGARSS
jgi:curved DNA-binding protein